MSGDHAEAGGGRRTAGHAPHLDESEGDEDERELGRGHVDGTDHCERLAPGAQLVAIRLLYRSASLSLSACRVGRHHPELRRAEARHSPR